MAKLTLVIGNRNYSSWSLRGYLVMAATGAPYETVLVRLSQPDTRDRILEHSSSGRVPALVDGDFTIWDSLSIAEYLAEKFPAAQLWPSDDKARAVARSVSAEMHSGFAELRTQCPCNMRKSAPHVQKTPAVLGDVARILEIWRECRAKFGKGGPYLFGHFTIADAFYAPVVSRFRTYAVDVDPNGRAYMETIEAHPAYRAWLEEAKKEPWTESKYEL
jgi:glutathione S-transferase